MSLFVAAVIGFLFAGPLIRQAQSFGPKKESGQSKEETYEHWKRIAEFVSKEAKPPENFELWLAHILAEDNVPTKSLDLWLSIAAQFEKDRERMRMLQAQIEESFERLRNELERTQRQGRGIPKT